MVQGATRSTGARQLGAREDRPAGGWVRNTFGFITSSGADHAALDSAAARVGSLA